jgi:hypothetical protein
MNKNNKFCNNCGKKNHEYKECKDPITSIGVILFKINNNINYKDVISYFDELNYDDIMNYLYSNNYGINANSENNIEIFGNIKNMIEFLMIKRKYTLGYIEFIRGRYQIDNIDGLVFLFQQMTKEEINNIGELSFDELWNNFWNYHEKNNLNNSSFHLNNREQEYIKSKNKFDKLKNNDCEIGLNFYVNNIIPSWSDTDWGFPKGRRNKQEENINCGIREFEEETNFNSTDYEILKKIPPFVEEFIGTNGIKYKHIYYIGISTNNRNPEISNNNEYLKNHVYS